MYDVFLIFVLYFFLNVALAPVKIKYNKAQNEMKYLLIIHILIF